MLYRSTKTGRFVSLEEVKKEYGACSERMGDVPYHGGFEQYLKDCMADRGGDLVKVK